MAIKAIVNYSQTEEGIQFLEERQAEAVAKSLIKILTQVQLEELVRKLTPNLSKEV
ncbi:hypothetical protein [Clostridium tagluense]|uniref:hypothetical protein n=1 Tax=Clostridium tagluense TaxID=360422 RepID=UPI001CF0D5F6|nr:hypothetical protein [Clostridium tagluense]MCB2297757.1 hypothetical protein [Clostridium tagluense]